MDNKSLTSCHASKSFNSVASIYAPRSINHHANMYIEHTFLHADKIKQFQDNSTILLTNPNGVSTDHSTQLLFKHE